MAVHHESGFDAHFVEPVKDRYTCPICHLAAREPMLTKCGHQFCQECLRPLIRDGNATCPVCREELKESEMFLNNMTKREILSLKIYCDQREKGCSWQGELRQCDEHNQECGYVVEVCSNDCGEVIMRKDMDYHKQNMCSRRIVGCCYCDTQLEHGQLTVHYETCDSYSPQQCDFASAGCQFIGNKEQLQDHLEKNIVNHLSLTMQSVSNLQEKLASADKKQKRMETNLSVAEDELCDVKEKLQQTESLLLVANYGSFIKSLGVECLGKDDQKQSVEYVNTLLDDQTQISFEIGGTFVDLWKIKTQHFYHKHSVGCQSILSNKFYTRNPRLHLQLELISDECGYGSSQRCSYVVRVRCCDRRYDKRLHESKYLMSACLHDSRGYSLRVQRESDFSSSHGRGRETLCKVDLTFGATNKSLVVTDGLLVVFELELKS